MKHSIIYRLIMSLYTLLNSYYQESYTRKVINGFFSKLKLIYSTSIINKILSVDNKRPSIMDNSLLHKLVDFINWILRSLNSLFNRGVKGSTILFVEESLKKEFQSKENKAFMTLICIGVLISYNVLKLINNGFSIRTIIIDAVIIVAIFSVQMIKIGTTLENSFVFKLGKSFVIEPRGDINNE